MGGVERRISKSTLNLQSEMESATVDMENVESAGRKIINFSKDEDLAGIVWTADHRVVELNIVVDTYDMYCIISTGVEWVITRVIQNRDGKVDVYICEPMPDVIPINNAVLTYDDLY
ncbi:unnamed protein product [Rhizophagus irregularis]|nr:unnamed protein product [Rhizophagus irregularis]